MLNKLKHYLFDGYNDPETRWCRANTIVACIFITILIILSSTIDNL